MFLRNTWYVAAWSHELADQLLSRKILGEQILFFRPGSGGVAALADRCPHRFAPLRVGRIRGDAVDCGYHGLQFDGTGACTHNPHSRTGGPPNCRIRSYRAVERRGAIWLWPGDSAYADEAAIPDFGYITQAGHKTIFGGTLLKE